MPGPHQLATQGARYIFYPSLPIASETLVHHLKYPPVKANLPIGGAHYWVTIGQDPKASRMTGASRLVV